LDDRRLRENDLIGSFNDRHTYVTGSPR
jgi:hypothetical protein